MVGPAAKGQGGPDRPARLSVAVHLAGGRVTVDPFAGPASGRLVAVAPSGALDTDRLVAALDSTRSSSRSNRNPDWSTTGEVSRPC